MFTGLQAGEKTGALVGWKCERFNLCLHFKLCNISVLCTLKHTTWQTIWSYFYTKNQSMCIATNINMHTSKANKLNQLLISHLVSEFPEWKSIHLLLSKAMVGTKLDSLQTISLEIVAGACPFVKETLKCRKLIYQRHRNSHTHSKMLLVGCSIRRIGVIPFQFRWTWWACCHHYETQSTLHTNQVHNFQSMT